MHTHENYEIYCFLSGNAQYFVEGNIYTLKPGDILIMKQAEAHSLLIQSPVPYERIVVNFNGDALIGEVGKEICTFLDGRPLGKFNRYPAAKFQENHWLYYLDQLCQIINIEEQQLYLTVLMKELWKNAPMLRQEDVIEDSTKDMITYINRHLTEPLDLDGICQRFYLSKSQLNRKFKRMTGSTVWEYISTKRLLLAKQLLQNGHHPTYVAEKCGFGDYCTFFRAYKRKFEVSPKEDYRRDK